MPALVSILDRLVNDAPGFLAAATLAAGCLAVWTHLAVRALGS